MRRLIQIALALTALCVLGAIVGIAVFQALVLRDLPEIKSLGDYRPKIITRVFDAAGDEIASFSEQRRVVVPIESLPRHVTHAFVAAEDGAFYEHEGLDYAGIARAFLKNLRAGRIEQGGSTITQQVAKTFLLSSERKYVRKLKDMVLARRIEQHLDKAEILYLYLNQIYLGSGAYGIEAAAQTYFGKPASELSISEAAMIAGVVPAPSLWSPFNDLEMAVRKQNVVLRRMVEQGFIAEEQRQEELARPMEFATRDWNERRDSVDYFVEEVRRYLVDRFGNEVVLTEGLQVYTTLDPERQLAAYRAVRQGLREHDRRQGWRGPIRRALEEEWPQLLEEAAAHNREQRPATEWRHQGLVEEIDAGNEKVIIATGPRTRTELDLEQVAWVRPANPDLDGLAARRKSVSEIDLEPGDLVWLEVVEMTPADDPLGEAPPTYRYELYQEPEAEGALVAIDLETSSLSAIVGGYSFARSQFNRALQSLRQPGSAFKPLIYAAAIDRGYTPASIVYDTPIVYRDEETGFQWKPNNYSKSFHGPITLRWALAKSRNIATVKLLRDVGLGPTIQTARALGIASPLEDNLGLALGNSEVTLTELVRAYTTFAAAGRLIDPIFIREIRDRGGELLESDVKLIASQTAEPLEETGEAVPIEELLQADAAKESAVERVMAELRKNGDGVGDESDDDQVLDPITAYLMTDLLRAVVNDGTGRRVRALRRPVAGKTGTTNDLYDAWFIGFTPQIAAGAWVGYDNARRLGRNETGSRTASPIFLDFMQRAHRGLPVREFDAPEGVVFVRIDKESGLLPCGPRREVLFQPFRDGSVPDESCLASAPGVPAGTTAPLRLD